MKQQNAQIIENLDTWLLKARTMSNCMSAWDVAKVDITEDDLTFFGTELYERCDDIQALRDVLDKELA
jgi:hypothetical protein